MILNDKVWKIMQKFPEISKSKISIVQINQTFQLNDSITNQAFRKGQSSKKSMAAAAQFWIDCSYFKVTYTTTTTTFGARAFFTDLCCAVQRLVKALLGNYLRNENVFTSFTIVYNFNWIELNYLVVVHYIITAFYSDAQHF